MMRRLFPSEVRTCSILLSKFWMRLSNVCTDWMGHGQRKCGPGPAWLVTRPKVVTTASSVLRTWKRNRSRTKISSKRAPTAMVMGLGFIADGKLKALIEPGEVALHLVLGAGMGTLRMS